MQQLCIHSQVYSGEMSPYVHMKDAYKNIRKCIIHSEQSTSRNNPSVPQLQYKLWWNIHQIEYTQYQNVTTDAQNNKDESHRHNDKINQMQKAISYMIHLYDVQEPAMLKHSIKLQNTCYLYVYTGAVFIYQETA